MDRAERFYDIIRDIGFTPSKAEPCIWRRDNQKLKCYEYVASYVDDLCIAAKNPGKIIQTQKEDYKLTVKSDGLSSHHFGTDYTRHREKTLVCQPKKYIDRLVDSYHSIFKKDSPKNLKTPLDKTETELINGKSILHYLTRIGQLQ